MTSRVNERERYLFECTKCLWLKLRIPNGSTSVYWCVDCDAVICLFLLHVCTSRMWCCVLKREIEGGSHRFHVVIRCLSLYCVVCFSF